MAYKSLIDYYGGGMVKPSDGYQLGGLVAGARRQRDYSGEMRSLQEAAERAAKEREKLLGGGGDWKDKLKSFALTTGATAIGGGLGAGLYKALEQRSREKAFKPTDFSGGKYAQDIRGEMNKRESQLKDQGLSRIGLAGLTGYMGGKAGGIYDKAASGVKGGIGQLRDVAGFLKEGGTMRDVLGGYAQKVGESGVFGKGSVISNRLLKSGASAGIAPTVPDAMKKTLSKEARQEAFTKGVEPMFEQNEWLWKTPGSTDSEWAVPDDAYAKSVLTPTVQQPTVQQPTPDWAGIEQDRLAAVQSASDAYSKRKEQYDWLKGRGVIEEPESPFTTDVEPLLADMSQGAIEEASPWMAQQPSAPQPSLAGAQPSMASSLMPDMPPAGFSGQDVMVGEAGVSEFEPFRIPTLLGESFEGYNPFDTTYEEFASDWMPAGIQTAGGVGYKGGGLIEGLIPRGYQDGGQVGYGTATNPQDALRQMGMGDVADDPRLEKYMEDLPQFGMGYKQQLGDITAGARSNLMGISQQARTQQAGSGFAGGGAGTMGQSRARQQLQRGFGSQRRGLVEGYQADLLSAIADIEGKGGFEFGSDAPGAGYSGSITETEALNTMAGYGGAEEQASASGAPQNAYSGQAWTNADGVELKWSSSRNNWLPAEQWDYYAQSQSDWA